ncbi:MAG: hypothetical protein WBX81_12155 [Nitrososphaeraceae archaeon]
MSSISKSITLRVPSDIIYRALKDTRLEELFPEFFVGVTRKILVDNTNNSVVQSIIQTHIANIVYSLLMLETGYLNGLMKQNQGVQA